MQPALWPRDRSATGRLLRVDATAGALEHCSVDDLPSLLRPGDLLVVNDSATLPASLAARSPRGEPVEIRLASVPRVGPWPAVLFGAGTWRTRTEERPLPPALAVGEALELEDGLRATITAVSPRSARLVYLQFDRAGSALWRSLYRNGRPVQYAYLAGPLRLWHVQTGYGARPWSVEAPSAGLPLGSRLLERLAVRGVEVAFLTHGAGLSSTGEADLDRALPLPERYDLPASTVDAIARAVARDGRVIATGTTVVRALEGCFVAHGGRLVAGEGTTDLILTAGHRLRVVSGIFTGVHEPGGSHYRMLQAFVSPALLREADAAAEQRGYLGHEFGDSMLLLAH